jgi:predicted CXXCH cytochrome family protein
MHGIAGFALSFTLACAPQTRHAVLDFVFDGVPPYRAPGEQPAQVAAGPTDPDDAWQLEYQRRVELNAQKGQEMARWNAHKPYAENRCESCHTSARFSELSETGWTVVQGAGEGYAGENLAEGGRLKLPIDELCLSCHETYGPEHPENAGFRLHGPVVSGWCISCHQAHTSPNESLLTFEPAARLCVQCHERADLLALTTEHRPSHPEQAFPSLEEARDDPSILRVVSDCTSCHDPHRGKRPYFLRAEAKLARALAPGPAEAP